MGCVCVDVCVVAGDFVGFGVWLFWLDLVWIGFVWFGFWVVFTYDCVTFVLNLIVFCWWWYLCSGLRIVVAVCAITLCGFGGV